MNKRKLKYLLQLKFNFFAWYRCDYALTQGEIRRQREYASKSEMQILILGDGDGKCLKRQTFEKYERYNEKWHTYGELRDALDSSETEFALIWAKGDELLPYAIYEIVAYGEKCGQSFDLLYFDHDEYASHNTFLRQEFVYQNYKPDYNPDLLLSQNYMGKTFVVRRKFAHELCSTIGNDEPFSVYDFLLRCVEHTERIAHLPKVLYHIKDKMPDSDETAVIEAHLNRRHLDASVIWHPDQKRYEIFFRPDKAPKVSIIIPNRDEKATLQKCIDSIQNNTSYSNYEIVVVENNSNTDEIFKYYDRLKQQENVVVLRYEDIFNFAKINNFAASKVDGDYLLFLNNDTEVIAPDWLSRMVGSCQRKKIGMVGAKLLYPDDTLQHVGVYIGMGGVAGHGFVGLPDGEPGRNERAVCQQNLSAVTGACMLISADIFQKVGGFDENLQVAFNDIDLCLRIRELGYLISLEPDAKLYHYESKSRGLEDSDEKKERFQREAAYFQNRHSQILEMGDPYFSPNLSPVFAEFFDRKFFE